MDEVWLNSALVAKHFGKRPHLGRRLPITMKRYTGIKWSQWKGKFVPFEQTVNVVVALTPVRGKKDMWRVSVDPKYYETAMQWLLTTVGAEVPPKTKRHYTRPRRAKLANWGRLPMKVDNS